MAGIAFDFREAARGLLRHRSVAVLALTCLALGVGTSAAMLGLLDALLFRPPAHAVGLGVRQASLPYRSNRGAGRAHVAQRRDILWLVLRQGLGIGILESVASVLLALRIARFLQPLLFQVSASDPLILGSTSALVLLLALLASWISGQRVRHVDPAVVLRGE